MVKVQKNNLQKLINEKEANEYIKLRGHKNLEEIYIKYQLYLWIYKRRIWIDPNGSNWIGPRNYRI